MFPRVSLHGKLAISAASSVLIGFLLIIEDLSQYVEFTEFPWAAEIGGLLMLSGYFLAFLANSVENQGWLADQVLGRYYFVRWYVHQFRIEYRILAYGGIALLLILGASIFVPGVFVSEPESPENVLRMNAQILATIFAITISLTLLGLEYYSRRLTPRIAKSVLQSTFIKLLLTSYVLSIAANVAVLSFFADWAGFFLLYSFLALVWCLLYLIAYLYNLIRWLQPRSQLEIIERSILDSFPREIVQKYRQGRIRGTDQRDRFVDIQKIIIRTVRENDIYLFGEWMDLLFGKEIEYLEDVQERKEQGDPTLSNDEAEAISNYFLHLQRQIYQEILNTDSVEFLNAYIVNISHVIIQLIEIREAGWMNEVIEHFNKTGIDIVENEYESVFQSYGDALQEVAEAEIASMPRKKKHIVLNDAYKGMDELSDEEHDERMWFISSRDMFTDRLSFLEDYAEAATERNFKRPVRTALQICTEYVQEALDEEVDPFSNLFINNTLRRQKRIHDNAVEHGVEVSFFWPIGLGDIIETLDPDEVDDIGVGLVELFCDSAVLAVENDVWNGYHDLGVLGRTVMDRHPEVVLVVVDALEECLERVPEDEERDHVTCDMIIEQLHSLYEWQEHSHKEVNERIEEIYKEHDIDIEEIIDDQ
ncbi:DUF2254 family protein [Natronococcus jeotgali]|uniref:Uncharacterized protein n=1 Tax=Natronococcus jeotgali DSM 18795 TaxID=1227498 RepID=L9XF37_9EURY|nr:DUF2254 family protein [Natronococcus jeotgali]ELY59293.1 hypothetical protein C492_11160 [Natronococcus jeotgali DSM 18795]